MAGVTQVGVRPTHRRRGMLSTLMRRQLADVHEAGDEAIAALWASESVIYGRFGYGMATLTTDLAVVDARRDVPQRAGARRRRADARGEAVERMRADPRRRARPATRACSTATARGGTAGSTIPRASATAREPMRAAVIDGAAYALYAGKLKFEEGQAAGEAIVHEVVSTTPEVARGDLELPALARPHPPRRRGSSARSTTRCRTCSPRRGPCGSSCRRRAVGAAGRPAARATRARLRAAVRGRARGRRRRVPVERGPLRAALGRRRARPARRPRCPAALELSVAELGAAYLGGTTLDELARAGRVRELRGGALAAATRAFRADRGAVVPGDLLSGQRSQAPRGTRPPSAPASVAGPRGAAMPSTRIAFRPRPSFSRPSVDDDVEPGQVAHALEPVADRVAVGEQPLRRCRRRCRRRRGTSRASARGRSRTARRRRRAARPSRRRSAAARPGPRSSPAAAAGRRRCPRTRARVLVAARLGDVGGQQRLVAGAVQVGWVGRDARVADREREAVQARSAARAATASADAAATASVVGRAASTTTWPARVGRRSTTAASDAGRARARAPRSAAASTRARQSSSAGA